MRVRLMLFVVLVCGVRGLPDEPAHAQETFAFAPGGRIAGRVVGADGTGIAGVTVEVVASTAKPDPNYGWPSRSVTSGTAGFFELNMLGPGRYVVGVNLRDLPTRLNPYARTMYPGDGTEPRIIELALGQSIDLGTWRLPPPLSIARIEGVVTRDGVPVAGVHVVAWDVTGDPIERARGAGDDRSDAGGRFLLELRQSRTYTFTAHAAEGRALRICAPRLETAASERLAIDVLIVEDTDKR